MSKYIVFAFITTCFLSCKKNENTKLSGAVFGTSYSVIYNSPLNYQKQFDSLFSVLNKSLSTYQKNSDISKLNRNENVTIDSHFITVYDASKDIFKKLKAYSIPLLETLLMHGVLVLRKQLKT